VERGPRRILGHAGFSNELKLPIFCALCTGEFSAQPGAAAFGSGDPFARVPGRVVADVASVAALEVGDPVAFSVLVKGDDLAKGGGRCRRFVHSSHRMANFLLDTMAK